MDGATQTLLREHVRRFNEAVADGDFGPLVELFADDAELAFANLPIGPFVGRDAIAAAYAAQPPDDGLDVLSVAEEPDGVVVEHFAWHRGGSGTMRIALAGGRIARLVVAFDKGQAIDVDLLEAQRQKVGFRASDANVFDPSEAPRSISGRGE